MLRSIAAALLLAASAQAANWTEYRIGPLRVISNAGDGEARRWLTEMEQLRFVLGGWLGKDPIRREELEAIWPIALVLFDSPRERAAYALPQPFVEGGSMNLSTTPSPAWRAEIARQLIEANAGRMPQEIETALADLLSTIEVRTSRVAVGAPVRDLPPERHRAWAKLHMLATQPEYSGRLRVYLKNLEAGDADLAAFNAYGIRGHELEDRMNAYADRGVFHAVEVFGEAITPSKEFYERRLPQAEVDALLAELKAAGKSFPPESARGYLAQGTLQALYLAAEANPKWGEPHYRLALRMQNPLSRIAPLERATQLEPRRIEYWEALAQAQTEAGLYIEAAKSWLGAERAAANDSERERVRRARRAIEEQRVEAELAAARAARDEAERELRRIQAESDARIRAAEAAANRANAAQATFTEGRAPVTFEEAFRGVRLAGRLIEVECEAPVLKLVIQLPNSTLVTLLVRKNPEVNGQPVFSCGPVSPARSIELVHDGKADVRWNTVGEVETYELK